MSTTVPSSLFWSFFFFRAITFKKKDFFSSKVQKQPHTHTHGMLRESYWLIGEINAAVVCQFGRNRILNTNLRQHRICIWPKLTCVKCWHSTMCLQVKDRHRNRPQNISVHHKRNKVSLVCLQWTIDYIMTDWLMFRWRLLHVFKQ